MNFYDELQSSLRCFTMTFDCRKDSQEPIVTVSKVSRLDLNEQRIERIRGFAIWVEQDPS